MAKKTLTEAEGKIMEALWEHAPMTMMEITHALEQETGWSKHTVTTLLKRMLEKGTIAMDDSGPVRRYTPAIAKEDVAREETRSLLRRLFSGKASLLVSNLVEEGQLSEEDLSELMAMIRSKKEHKP